MRAADGGNVACDLLDSVAGMDARAMGMVLRVSQAALGAQHFDDAVEVIAQHSLVALEATSLSMLRWNASAACYAR